MKKRMRSEERKKHPVLRGAAVTIVFLLGIIAALLCSSVAWMFKTWNNLSMDELMYQLKSPMEGTNQDMILDYINFCIPFTILVLVVFLLLFLVFRRSGKYLVILAAVFCISVTSLGGTAAYAWHRLDIGSYSKNQSKNSSFIDDNYVDPKSVSLTFPEKKRNLIYIFMESMETTFADKENGGGFDENVIPALTKLAQENEDFSGSDPKLDGGYAMPSATWTVAAMFAQTSGLPLTIPIEQNSMSSQTSFLPDVTTIGNILEDEGYQQTLMIGSDATFGGRRQLFSDHGNYNIKDYNYALENGMIPANYRVWWGYEDAKLYDFAKEELQEMSSSDQPFNLTLLTVDTHFEDGYFCQYCKDEFPGNHYADVMACAGRQVAAFVHWVQKQDFYENTTIVISGDHPTMDSDFCDDVDSSYERKVATIYINPAAENQNPEARREYTTFDNFPTTLAAMGVQIEGDRLGLGTNLFSGKETLSEANGTKKMESELRKNSKLMEKLTQGINKAQAQAQVAEEEQQKTPSPTADLALDDFTRETNRMSVHVSNIQDRGLGTSSVNVAVWTDSHQSDLQWTQAQELPDGSYTMDVDLSSFHYRIGEYKIAVYLVDANGESHNLGSLRGHVQ